jgi:hypothetical protein
MVWNKTIGHQKIQEEWPRPRDGNDPPYISSLGLQDTSYVRLQNVSVGYTLPERYLTH